MAFRGDHWLHKYGDPLGPEAAPIRAAMRKQFYPDTDEWKEMVLFRGHQVVRQAIKALNAPRGDRRRTFGPRASTRHDRRHARDRAEA